MLWQAQAASAAGSTPAIGTFGKAKRVLLLFMWGGPAHQDTWDLKPDGPSETRGEFLPIATNVSGLEISEHFPLLARQADKLALIRSVAQEDNNHSTGAHAGLTGRRHTQKKENFSASESDFPHYGSVLSKLRPGSSGLPAFVSLPDVIATTGGAVTPGQGGGMLGRKYDPFQIIDHPDRDDFSIASMVLPDGMHHARLQNRRGLLDQLDRTARLTERSATIATMDAFYSRALDMVLSPAVRSAFDISRLPDRERERYGWHTFGQSVLLARQLLEAGVQLVTVYWHRERATIDSSWDTHAVNFRELKTRLMPVVDRPFAALLEDLAARGMLEDTLVVWNSEFGRTPRINKNAGRDHWGPCNTVVMAGGGVPGGQVYGATDPNSAYPTRDHVTQDDIAATMYHLLGIDPHTLVHDRLGRPFPISLGQPITKLLGGECTATQSEESPPKLLTASAFQPGPLTSMLMQRGRRYLSLDFGDQVTEADWTLTDFESPQGEGSRRYRRLMLSAALAYNGIFYKHFEYGFLALWLRQPRSLANVQITLDGKPIPLPAATLENERDFWQIPFPAGMIATTSTCQLKFVADDPLELRGLAFVGDEIHPRFVAKLSRSADSNPVETQG